MKANSSRVGDGSEVAEGDLDKASPSDSCFCSFPGTDGATVHRERARAGGQSRGEARRLVGTSESPTQAAGQTDVELGGQVWPERHL